MAGPANPNRDDLVVVGAIAGAHGVHGDVRIKSFTADPEALFTYGPLLGEDGAVLLQAASHRPAKGHFVVKPNPPRTREDWEALKGTRLHVPRSTLPRAEPDEFYVDDLIGLDAISETGERLGRVKAVQNFGAGDLLEIQPATSGKSVLIPFTEADVPALNIDKRQLTIASWRIWTEEDDADES